jgi:hypothetical protein
MVETGIDHGKINVPRHIIDNYCFSLDEKDGSNWIYADD